MSEDGDKTVFRPSPLQGLKRGDTPAPTAPTPWAPAAPPPTGGYAAPPPAGGYAARRPPAAMPRHHRYHGPGPHPSRRV